MTTYTTELVGDLDVIDTYKELMEASTGPQSAYLRTKETLVDMFENTTFTDQEKSTVIAQTLSTIATSITTGALDAAIKIATENRDAKYALTKIREDTKFVTAQTAKVEQDISKSEADTDSMVWENYKRQASLYRDWGVKPWELSGNVGSTVENKNLIEDGTKVQENKMAKASLYTTYAKSYRQDGIVMPIVSDTTGYMTTAAGDDYGQSYWQNMVTERQWKGFDDNMRQHVANSSASMISMLLSTEVELPTATTEYLNQWDSSLSYLNNTLGKADGTITVTSEGTMTLGSAHTISGTSSNLTAGTNITVKYTAAWRTDEDGENIIETRNVGFTIVQENGTWVEVVDSSKVNMLTGQSVTVTLEALSPSGKTARATFVKLV